MSAPQSPPPVHHHPTKAVSEPAIATKGKGKPPPTSTVSTPAITPPSPLVTSIETAQKEPPALDNLQELLQRKRELEKNKHKFHLTEADCNLLVTNANEFSFTNGQVIAKEGQEITSVFRIKSGKVTIVSSGKKVCELSQGWFLGETLLINGRCNVFDAAIVANGPVTLAELNLSFVKRLFEVDNLLALKFYRHLAAKLASVSYVLVGHLLGSCLMERLPSTAELSIASGVGSPHIVSPGVAPTIPMSSASTITSLAPMLSKCPNLPDSFFLEVVNRRRKPASKRKSISMQMHLAFKEYALEGNGKSVQSCRLKRNKIKLISESFGFKHKNTIEYTKIKNIVRTSEKSVTIIYDRTGKTLFFKTPEDAEEFYGLSTSLVETTSHEAHKSVEGTPISSPPAIDAETHHTPYTPPEDEEMKTLLRSIATTKEMRKGEFIFEEGDLYQRVYSIIAGEVAFVSGGRQLKTAGKGEVIGVQSLLHLRPAPVGMVVISDTATISIIPAFRINELINSNTALAARLYKRASEMIQKHIDNVMHRLSDLERGIPLSESGSSASGSSSSSLTSSGSAAAGLTSSGGAQNQPTPSPSSSSPLSSSIASPNL